MKYTKKEKHSEDNYAFSKVKTANTLFKTVGKLMEAGLTTPGVCTSIQTACIELANGVSVENIKTSFDFWVYMSDRLNKVGVTYAPDYDYRYDTPEKISKTYEIAMVSNADYLGKPIAGKPYRLTANGVRVGTGRFFAIRKIGAHKYVIDAVRIGKNTRADYLKFEDVVDLAHVLERTMLKSGLTGRYPDQYKFLAKHPDVKAFCKPK